MVDNSGIRFLVTSQLREFDAGIMELGQEYTDKFALPPGLPVWQLDGYCVPQCTAVVSGSEDVTVILLCNLGAT